MIINQFKNRIMAKSFLIFTLLLIAMTGYAQVNGDSTKRTKEFLITTTSLISGNYGLQYKLKYLKNPFLDWD